MISSILYGARLSLAIGLSALTIAAVLGVGLGLAAGYYGGRFDAFVMRIADVQLALPAILTIIAYILEYQPVSDMVRYSPAKSFGQNGQSR